MELDVALAVLGLSMRGSAAGGADRLSLGERVGRFEIVGDPIGSGGSGDLYPATDPVRGGRFAIKWAKADLPAAERIFAEERHKARLLHHRNTLVAHDGGMHEGRPYLVFRRLEGHLTNEVRVERYATPEAIVELLQKVVGAVAFAHGRAVLHCDLKPSNILFDEAGEPHVADFGLARTIEGRGSTGEAWGGSRGWMSPEQITRQNLDVRSDVFTLGVLLYWLLAGGKLPFGAGADYEERVLHEGPEPLPAPGRFAARLRWDLAAICRKALQKHPAERYDSAADLLRDLERAGAKRLPVADERGFPSGRRVLRWVRRHPWLAFVGLTALALPPYAFAIQNDALTEVRSALRPQSRFGAVAQARAVLSELYGMSLRVHGMAQDPQMLGLLQHGGIHREAPALKPHAAGFDSVNVLSADGTHHARWPAGPKGAERNVTNVDHFACARKLAHDLLARPRPDAGALPVCVARAHRSGLDGKIKLGLSAPLLVAGRMVGVVEASTMARDSFGALQMNCGPGDCFTALIGPRDRDEARDPLPAALSILAQRALPVGGEQRLPADLSRRICATVGCVPDPLRPFEDNPRAPLELDFYRDPLSGASTVAVVAPVARTGLSVLIATPHSATDAKLADIVRAAFSRLWLPPLFAFAVWLCLYFAPNPRWPWPAKTATRRA